MPPTIASRWTAVKTPCESCVNPPTESSRFILPRFSVSSLASPKTAHTSRAQPAAYLYRLGLAALIFPMVRSAFILAVQLVSGVLLVSFGWGFDVLSEFLRNPARAGLTVVVMAGVLASIFLRLDFKPLRRGSVPIGKQNLQLGVLFIASLFLLWFLPFADRRSILTLRHDYWRDLGLLLFCIGVSVRPRQRQRDEDSPAKPLSRFAFPDCGGGQIHDISVRLKVATAPPENAV